MQLTKQEDQEIKSIFFEKIKKYNELGERYMHVVLYKQLAIIITYEKGWHYALGILDN